MRTFIAIPIPQPIKESLGELQQQLKISTSSFNLKWVRPENIHITLKFLGEVKEEKIIPIKKTIEKVCSERPVFDISIGGLGAFPKKESARVIWVGIEKGGDLIRDLSTALEENLAKLGIPKEKRPFSSHITLARLNLPQNLKPILEKINIEKKEFSVQNIILYKSTLTSQGPIYEELYTSNLKTS